MRPCFRVRAGRPILLRYYEDLPPREVAHRLGVPVKTVNSRITRGLERLRASWKRAHGKDDRRLAALGVGLAPGTFSAPSSAAAPTTPSALPLGLTVMNAKLVLVAAAVLGGGGLFWLWSQTSPAPTPALELSEVAAFAPKLVHAPPDETPYAPSTSESPRATVDWG